MKSVLFLAGLGLCLSGLASTSQMDVIYGEDNRHDLYEYPDRKIVDLAKSTVALVHSGKLSPIGSLLQMSASTFQEDNDLCSTERFGNQPTAAFCSGFLIAPNKIATAGHCITDADDCADVRFVFDYAMKDANKAQMSFETKDIYSCKKILGRDQKSAGIDFAVIELDRNVIGRTPLKLSSNLNTREGDTLFVVGHPSGLPTKITDEAKVRTIKRDAGFLVANTDTYGGNSGSAVFNEKTLEVEGILVRGENDFTTSPDSCTISYQVNENSGRGEDITLISRIHENGNAAQSNSTPSLPSVPTTPATPNGDVRYVYLSSDNSCNEFQGDSYIREVDMSLCPEASASSEYIYLSSDNTCNEFRSGHYIREVDLSLCGSSVPASEYVWLDTDNTCNEFRAGHYIREVSNSLCAKS